MLKTIITLVLAFFAIAFVDQAQMINDALKEITSKFESPQNVANLALSLLRMQSLLISRSGLRKLNKFLDHRVLGLFKCFSRELCCIFKYLKLISNRESGLSILPRIGTSNAETTIIKRIFPRNIHFAFTYNAHNEVG